MPHSKRPRRARVNKLRLKKGLPPLMDEYGQTLESMRPAVPPIGVTTLMVPLPTPIRAMLTQVRREMQLKDPSTAASDQLFAGAVLTAILPTMLQQVSPPPLIAAPTKANLEQAHKVGQILAGGHGRNG